MEDVGLAVMGTGGFTFLSAEAVAYITDYYGEHPVYLILRLFFMSITYLFVGSCILAVSLRREVQS